MEYVKSVISQCNKLFEKKQGLDNLNQKIAEMFHPERANFTTGRSIGDELCDGLMTSYTILVCRDLGNAFGAMLRPTAKPWFHIRTTRSPESDDDTPEKQWLERTEIFLRNVMGQRESLFARATTEADRDFAAFGQAVLSVEYLKEHRNILFRCWHLRDVAWMEDLQGNASTVYRRWLPTAVDLAGMFPKTVHSEVTKLIDKDPYKEINVIHCVMPTSVWMKVCGGKKFLQPYVSCYVDVANVHCIEMVGIWTNPYVIPRWSMSSGSQYASSPASVAGLPDARLIQDVTATVLDAAKMAIKPPMTAVDGAIVGDVALYPGGITIVDRAYDDRTGKIIEPLSDPHSNIPIGLELIADIRTQLADAFYISKLTLPPVDGKVMTATEVARRMEEYTRHAVTLFEPMESEYNGRLCETTLEILMREEPRMLEGMPETLGGAEFTFSFESPLRDALEKIKVGQLMEAWQILAQAVQFDENTILILDNALAVRDALSAVSPKAWMRDKDTVRRLSEARAKEQQTQQMLAMMQQGADVAKTIKEASPTVGQGGL
jgi:hypothetical protein